VSSNREHGRQRPATMNSTTQILLLVLFATALAVLAFAAASVVLV
jgi:hypothetical protein